MKDRDSMILEKIQSYCKEIAETHEYFQNDKTLFYDQNSGFVYRNSITMPILQIGELAKNLSDEFRQEHDNIQWKSIAGMRDIFAHHYGFIDYDMVWSTSRDDIEELNSFCNDVLGQMHNK